MPLSTKPSRGSFLAAWPDLCVQWDSPLDPSILTFEQR